MMVSSKQINVFAPDDILTLRSSLESATERLQHQYGFNGSALDAAREIAANAICKAAQKSQRDTLYLEDEGLEAVRLFLISSRDSSAKRRYIKKSVSKTPVKTRGKELFDEINFDQLGA